MKLKILLAGLSLFSSVVYSQIEPVFSVNEDPVCSVFEQSYNAQLAQDKLPNNTTFVRDNSPSFKTNYIPIHKGSKQKLFTPDETSDIRVRFSKPIIDDYITWLEWTPLVGVQHKLSGYGYASRLTAVGSIKPAPDKSFVLQINTIGWRGPFYRVWIIEDSELQTIVQSIESIDTEVPIEDSGAVLISSDSERTFIPSLKNIFQFNNHFYTVDKEGVYKLENNEFKTVCQLGNGLSLQSPQIQALENAGNATLMTEGITHIPNYYGSMGSSFIKVENGFKDAIEKPWLIMVDENGMCFKSSHIDNCRKNKAIDVILKKFASQDPWSFREVQAIRQHMKSAQDALSEFYVKQLNVTSLLAKGISKQAVYNFVAKTVYLHPYLEQTTEALTAENAEEVDLYTLNNEQGSMPINWFNKTELMWAAHFNDYDAVQRLLKKYDNATSKVNAVTASSDSYASVQYLNRTALTYAVENATLPVIQALIKAGSDINIKDSEGNELDYYLAKNNLVNSNIKDIAAMALVEIKPSFNCKLASSAQEKAICADKGLAVYDKQMSTLYKMVRTQIADSNIKALQRSWLKELRQTCSMQNNTALYSCMKTNYRARIQYLNNLLVVDYSS